MSSAAGPWHINRHSGRWLVVTCLMLVGFAAIRLFYIHHSQIVADEFQHLHSAFLVSHGQIPYRDFYEHHLPLYYYLASIVLPLGNPGFQTLVYNRYLALLFWTVTVWTGFRWATRLWGRDTGFITLVLLLGNVFLLVAGSVAYLDTLAVSCLLASCLCLSSSKRALTFASGALLSLACLLSQKTATAGPAFVLYLVFRERAVPNVRRGRWQDLLIFSFGFLCPLVAVGFLLGPAGIQDAYAQCIAGNVAWKARRFPFRELLFLADRDGLVYACGLAGVLYQLSEIVKRRFRLLARDLPALVLLSLAGGIFVLPVVWEEYFVLLVPLCVLVAAEAITRMSFSFARNGTAYPLISLVAALTVADIFILLYGRVHPHPFGRWMTITVFVGWTIIALVTGSTQKRGAPSFLGGLLPNRQWLVRLTPASPRTLWVFGVLFPLLLLEVVQQVRYAATATNAEQRQQLAYVLAYSSEKDTVLDGYTGLGVFRQHAYRYWFLHEEIQLMLGPRELETGVLQALIARKPVFVFADNYIRSLPAPVQLYVAQHYIETPFPPILRIRKDTPVHLQ
jgi:hypothetical protein